MNCKSCAKPIDAAAKKCPACGAELGGSFSYDLLPDEPAKKEEGPKEFMLPPGAALPPGMPLPGAGGEKPGKAPLRTDRSRGGSGNTSGGTSLKTLGIGAAVLVILILLGMKMCGGSTLKVTGRTKWEGTPTLFLSAPRVENFEIIGGEADYSFTLEALDGEVLVGVAQRGAKEPRTLESLKKVSEGLSPVKKGESKTLSGRLGTGTYAFIYLTESKKSVRTKVKFLVK